MSDEERIELGKKKLVEFYKEVNSEVNRLETFLNTNESRRINQDEQYDLVQQFHCMSLLKMILTSRIARAQIDLTKYF